MIQPQVSPKFLKRQTTSIYSCFCFCGVSTVIPGNKDHTFWNVLEWSCKAGVSHRGGLIKQRLLYSNLLCINTWIFEE